MPHQMELPAPGQTSESTSDVEEAFFCRRRSTNGFLRRTLRALSWGDREAGPVGDGRELSRFCEFAVDEIGRLTRPIPDGRDGAVATAHAGQAGVPHQPGDTFATDTNAGIRKINLQPWCSIRAFRGCVRRTPNRRGRAPPSG
jgi:hypothetical protein